MYSGSERPVSIDMAEAGLVSCIPRKHNVYRTLIHLQNGLLAIAWGLSSEYDGTQDYDLALRASLREPKVVHLADFRLRLAGCSGFGRRRSKREAVRHRSSKESASRLRSQKHPKATVKPGWSQGFWRIVYPLPQPVPLLSYVIPTGGNSRKVRGTIKDLVLNCVRSFEAKQFYPNREYIIVHNGDLTLHNNASSAPSRVSSLCNPHPRHSICRRKSTKAWQLLVDPTYVF